MHQADLQRFGNCLRTTANAKFAVDVFQMKIHGLLGDGKFVCDLIRQQPAGNPFQDFMLLRRQREILCMNWLCQGRSQVEETEVEMHREQIE